MLNLDETLLNLINKWKTSCDTMTSMVNDSTTQISNKLVVIREDISIINEKIDTVSRKITHIESNQHSCTPHEIKQSKDSETQTEMTKSETSETQTESKKQETTKPKITGEATAVNTKYKPNIERNTPTSIFQQGASDSQERTLIIGDSTIKDIDKRKLLRGHKVSKAWAATVEHAKNKINNGDDSSKDNILFAVGVNDLKDGGDPDLFMSNIRNLVQQTHECYPDSKIYLCSILPVLESRVPRETVVQVNSFLETMPSYIEYVRYVNTFDDFLSRMNNEVLWKEDQMHPNMTGTLSLCSTIRKYLLKNKNGGYIRTSPVQVGVQIQAQRKNKTSQIGISTKGGISKPSLSTDKAEDKPTEQQNTRPPEPERPPPVPIWNYWTHPWNAVNGLPQVGMPPLPMPSHSGFMPHFQNRPTPMMMMHGGNY